MIDSLAAVSIPSSLSSGYLFSWMIWFELLIPESVAKALAASASLVLVSISSV
jgi:hypothetical protein